MANLRPTMFPHPLIGWREELCLPELAPGVLVAKIDTGARSAALHAENIVISGKHVTFNLEISGKQRQIETQLAGTKRVKSSNGYSELRPIIETIVELGQHRFIVEITLTDRADMGVPMLLGRGSIKGRFVVHPGRSFIISRKKKARP
jgi:hypothetical protein